MAETHKRFLVCLAVFVTLVVWLDYWPYSGEGDATLHFRNFRESVNHPEEMLTVWARPLFAALMIVPASFGVLAARLCAAVLTTVLVWQTMHLADDLDLRNPILAGPLVVWQPYAFALAADTMTEMPMALGIVLAIRLWLARRYAMSALVVSFLPMVRPEGFFLMPMWAVMLLAPRVTGLDIKPRLLRCLLLGTGMLCWVAACVLVVGDPFFIIRSWSWPPGSYAAYGNGALLDYVVRWPFYCGPILFPMFILGLLTSVKKRMALPWAVWLLVFLLHSILWWRGWFASVGLLRILACTSPLTALICLEGWNLIGRSRLWNRRSPKLRTGLILVVALLATAIPLAYYVNDARHHHPRLLLRAVNHLEGKYELHAAPAFFCSDELVLVLLNHPPRSLPWKRNLWDRDEQLEMLASLPPGSLGIWDNQRGKLWFQVDIEDLANNGYEILFETEQTPGGFFLPGLGFQRWPENQRCVVVRKRPADR